MNIKTASIETRGLIESATLPDASTIGLTLTDAGGSTYDNIAYSNIKATASTGATPQTWTLASDILLSSTNGTLYAYYPYSSGVTDITQIPVTAGDTDYMYATSVENLNDGNYSPTVTMNHALAAIRLNIVRGTYTGTGAVTSVSIKGDNIATSGTLNAKNGALSSQTGVGTAIADNTAFTLSTTAKQIDYIMVPVTGTSATPVFSATIDGSEYTATPASVTLAQGTIYQYTLTVNSKEISLSDVKVGDWGYNDSGSPVINAGYNITLAGDIEGIAFSNIVNTDGTVTIEAVPKDFSKNVSTATVGSGAMVTQKLSEGTGILYLTLTDITSDVTLTFNGLTTPLEGTINLTTASTGVYAVAKNGKGVTYENADESCVGVALIVIDAPTPQRLMIEKYGESNTTSIKAAYTADGASNTSYTYFYWGMYSSDNKSITHYTQVGGGITSYYGYLPLASDLTSYYSTSNNIPSDWTSWTSGVLSDFKGKANTAALQSASDTDSDTTYANMGTYVTKFNATSSENQGETDWYIPSAGQLALIQMHTGRGGDSKVVSEGVNEMLTKIGGTTFNTSDYYWSSSEYSSVGGWGVSFREGRMYDNGKNIRNRVRLVRDI